MTAIETPRLLLRPLVVPEIEAALQGDDALAARLGIPVAAGWLEFPEALPFFLSWLQDHPALPQWMLYGYLGRAGEGLVGAGGFKGPPDAEGVVEIGYGLAPAFRARGLATESAEAFVRFAFAHPEVTSVRAHTLPAPNASTRVLARAGFTCEGAVQDPDDGEVWRWHRLRRTAPTPTTPG